MEFLAHLWEALVLAAAMAWRVGWSLVLGFTLSGVIQAVVSKERMRVLLGRDGPREIALATAYGAASSSCSYAAAAVSRTIFKKGAGFRASLAFLFASTNLVVELGLILYVLMGWQFTAAEWIGGLVLVAVMSLLVALTYPAKLVEAARAHGEARSGHDHGDDNVAGATLWEKLRNPSTRIRVAQNVAMDWSMLRSDLAIGFLVAGALAAFVPAGVWKTLFVTGLPPALGIPLNAAAGALIAIFTFVCSIGNVPMAAILWGTGMSFGGVLAFLYSDLIVLPLLDVYRKYYGLRMTAYIFGIFFVTIVVSATLMDAAFSALHAVPQPNAAMRTMLEHVSLDYTFWLNVVALGVVGYFWFLNRRHPTQTACAMHEGHAGHGEAGAPGADAEHSYRADHSGHGECSNHAAHSDNGEYPDYAVHSGRGDQSAPSGHSRQDGHSGHAQRSDHVEHAVHAEHTLHAEHSHAEHSDDTEPSVRAVSSGKVPRIGHDGAAPERD